MENCKFIIHNTCYTAQQASAYYDATDRDANFVMWAVPIIAVTSVALFGLLLAWCNWADNRKGKLNGKL
jgi:uncharacterized protein (DUF983 family)